MQLVKSLWTQKNLAAVILATECFMLTDRSRNFQSSVDFIDRRIENLLQLEDLAENTVPTLQGLQIGLGSLFDMFQKPPKM